MAETMAPFEATTRPVPGADPIAPPSVPEVLFDRGFRGTTATLAYLSLGLVVFIVVLIGIDAWPAIQQFDVSMLTEKQWDPANNLYGLRSHIWGTLYSSFLALLIGSVFGIAVAIFISEDFLPYQIRAVLKNIVQLLAAIPSVIYGLWGLEVVVPNLRKILDWFVELHASYGDTPVLGGILEWLASLRQDYSGPGMLSASLVLAIMVLPTITALTRDALASVNPKLREGALGLGATRWEAIYKILLPTASSGITGAIILAFGRALGETMALAMLVGNANVIHFNPLMPGNTLAALLANNFNEASGMQTSALMYAAVVLMLITLFVNILGSIPSAPAYVGRGFYYAIIWPSSYVWFYTTLPLRLFLRRKGPPPGAAPVELDLNMNWTPFRFRTFLNSLLTGITGTLTFIAMIPLFLVLYMVIVKGGARLMDVEVLTSMPPVGNRQTGGFANAIVGTLIMVGLAGLIAIPFGILVAVYLAEFGEDGRVARAVRFAAKLMTGLPSIIAGVFGFAVLVVYSGKSAFAGGVALAMLMLPTVILTAEEALRQVPRKMREAAYGMGCTHTQVVIKVVLPTAMANILTGVMLAIARAAGETAPLLFTATFSIYMFRNMMEPTASLAVFIYTYARVPYDKQVELAWAASLVLGTIVLSLNVLAQLITLRAQKHQPR